MTRTIFWLISVAVVTASCRTNEPGGASSSTQTAKPSAPLAVVPAGLRQVEPKKVCMVNNRYMGAAQIPTDVDGRTYYGCCAGCAGRLRDEPGVRSANDPVSGEKVDKAMAIIAATDDGDVLYFKNATTLAAYHR